jgi:hypothetical protein
MINLRQTKETISDLTHQEKQIFKCALRWYKAYDDSNPDVGMGPGYHSLVNTIAEGSQITLSEKDKEYFVNWLRSNSSY